MLENISIVGLGKLGATTLAVLASKGFNMTGIDINENTLKKINNCEAPVFEPGLEELLKENKDRIYVTTNYELIKDTDMTIIIVPTPSTSEGGFSTQYVEDAISSIAIHLADKKDYHNVVVTSTVLPGSMEEIIKPKLESLSRKKVGKNLGLCYNPDFIALGDIINGLTNPDMVLIGESDKKAGDMVEEMHIKLIGKGDEKINPIIHRKNLNKIHRMSLHNAELAKISLNAYITMKISFANTIAEICEKMPTGNAEDVLDAIGADTRIGKKYLRGGLSYGGPCFPRDNKAFMHTATKYGSQSLLSQMTDTVNITQIHRITSYILDVLSEKGTNKLSILGLTYKPNTVVTEESAALKIMQNLTKEGIEVAVYDPAPSYAMPMVSGIVFSKSIEQCLTDAQVCFIATPWQEFKELSKETFLKYMKNPVVIDAWGIQNKLRYDTEIDYRQIGIHHD